MFEHDGLGRAFDPPLQGLDPLQQHLDAERLRDVVVGAQREADDLVGFLGLGGEHEDRYGSRRFGRPKLPANVQAVHPRQHQVQDDQVGRIGLRAAQPFKAVVGHGDFVAFALQVVNEHLGQRPFILDDKDSSLGHCIS